MRFRFSNLPIALLAVVAVASMIRGATEGGRDRATATYGELDHRCEIWRGAHPGATGDPCNPSGPYAKMIPVFRTAQSDIATARARLAAGDVDRGVSFVSSALGKAHRMDLEGTIIGSLMAAKVMDDALDIIEANKPVLGRQRTRELLTNTKLWSAQSPLEGERLATKTNIASIPKDLPVPTGPFGRMLAAQAMKEKDRTLGAMETAILERDVEGCKRAASAEKNGFYPMLCEKLVNVVNTQARIEHVRKNALIRG